MAERKLFFKKTELNNVVHKLMHIDQMQSGDVLMVSTGIEFKSCEIGVKQSKYLKIIPSTFVTAFVTNIIQI